MMTGNGSKGTARLSRNRSCGACGQPTEPPSPFTIWSGLGVEVSLAVNKPQPTGSAALRRAAMEWGLMPRTIARCAKVYVSSVPGDAGADAARK